MTDRNISQDVTPELLERIRKESAASLPKRMKRLLRRKISTVPAVYVPLRRRRRADTVAGPDTDFLLEGYPRCGNTWAEMALRHAATGPIKMAHHSHAAAHVIHGLRLGIPTLVLFRAPDPSVRSLLAMSARNMTALDAYSEYVLFYETVLKQSRDNLALASFEDVTQHIDKVAVYLRDRFGLPFEPFDADDPEQKAAVFARMDARAAEIRPDSQAVSRSNPTHYDAEQVALKQFANEQIAALADHPLRKRAQVIYDSMSSDIA